MYSLLSMFRHFSISRHHKFKREAFIEISDAYMVNGELTNLTVAFDPLKNETFFYAWDFTLLEI